MATNVERKGREGGLSSSEQAVVDEFTGVLRKHPDQNPATIARLAGVAFHHFLRDGRSGADKLAQARMRGLEILSQLAEAEGGSVSSEEAARTLRISKTAALKRLAAGRLLAWREERLQAARFPRWQFDHRGRVLEGLEDVLKILARDERLDPWGKVLFFLQEKASLGGRRPLDLLREGKLEEVCLGPARMPNDPGPARAQFRPGPDFGRRAIPVTRQPSRVWFRAHKLSAPAVVFGRLPHHRFSHPRSPFPLLYVAATIQTCLWEVFGDDVYQAKRAISSGKWNGCGLSQIVVPELKVCAVILERTRVAMSVDKASLLAADLRIPQAWGLAVQDHPAGFEAIKYGSRFLDQACLALFDRLGLQSRLRVTPLGPLNDLEAAVDWLDEQNAALV